MRFLWTRDKEAADAYSLEQVKSIYEIFKDIVYDKVPVPPDYDKKYRISFSYLKAGGGHSYIRIPFPYPPEAPYVHLPSNTFRFHFSGDEDLATIHDEPEANAIINTLKTLANQIHPRLKGETPAGEEKYYCATINPEAITPHKPFFIIIDGKYYEEDKWWEKFNDRA